MGFTEESDAVSITRRGEGGCSQVQEEGQTQEEEESDPHKCIPVSGVVLHSQTIFDGFFVSSFSRVGHYDVNILMKPNTQERATFSHLVPP